jgi:hypothetical protein
VRPRSFQNVPGLGDPALTPFQRFEKFARMIVSVPRTESNEDKGKSKKVKLAKDRVKGGLKMKAQGYSNKTAKAAHISEGNKHVVGIGNLRVFIVDDGPFWYAQGLEIDYGAQGDTIEEAKKNFEMGLEQTIDFHLSVHGNIVNMLEPAPPNVLREAARTLQSLERYWQVSIHEVTGIDPQWFLPFEGIDYWAPRRSSL